MDDAADPRRSFRVNGSSDIEPRGNRDGRRSVGDRALDGVCEGDNSEADRSAKDRVMGPDMGEPREELT